MCVQSRRIKEKITNERIKRNKRECKWKVHKKKLWEKHNPYVNSHVQRGVLMDERLLTVRDGVLRESMLPGSREVECAYGNGEIGESSCTILWVRPWGNTHYWSWPTSLVPRTHLQDSRSQQGWAPWSACRWTPRCCLGWVAIWGKVWGEMKKVPGKVLWMFALRPRMHFTNY